MRSTPFLVALIVLGTAIPAAVCPAPSLATRDPPDQVRPRDDGEATTIEFGFRVNSLTPGKVPSPVTESASTSPPTWGWPPPHSASPSAHPRYCSNKDPRAAQPTRSRDRHRARRAPQRRRDPDQTAVVQALLDRPSTKPSKSSSTPKPTHPSPPNSSSQGSHSSHHPLATAAAWTPRYHSSQPGSMVPT